MPKEAPIAVLSRLGAPALGVFRGSEASALGVSRDRLTKLRADGVIEHLLPDTYRLTAVLPSAEQSLRAALLWAGDAAAAAGRSAAALYGLEGVSADIPEIALPHHIRGKSEHVLVHHSDRAALMVRRVGGLPTTGVECTLVELASALDSEAFEIACEDARRRRLTSVPALQAYLQRFGRRGRPGVAPLRQLLREIDPMHAARSTLEVKTRRLLVASGLGDFVREFPLEWDGRTYRYDFAFECCRTILETNGRRWHDDPADYERDNEKWSVPGRHGYHIVFATWNKVVEQPAQLLRELATTLRRDVPAARSPR
jgi:very-short-patch-repair endonuclease